MTVCDRFIYLSTSQGSCIAHFGLGLSVQIYWIWWSVNTFSCANWCVVWGVVIAQLRCFLEIRLFFFRTAWKQNLAAFWLHEIEGPAFTNLPIWVKISREWEGEDKSWFALLMPQRTIKSKHFQRFQIIAHNATYHEILHLPQTGKLLHCYVTATVVPMMHVSSCASSCIKETLSPWYNFSCFLV